MKIVTVLFDRPGAFDYARLCRAFEASVADAMPKTKLVNVSPGAIPSFENQREVWANNLAKMRAWQEVDFGEPTLLLDCDLILQHSLAPLFELGADIVLTTGGASPFNAGVIALAAGIGRFVKQWLEIAEEMYVNEGMRAPYVRKYRGISQAALGWMLDRHRNDYQVAAVPARHWNARSGDWEHVTRETRAVHYKSELRKMVLGKMGHDGAYHEAIKLWERYDRP